MRARTIAAPSPLREVAVHSGAGAAVLWLAVLWLEAPRLAYGPICGDDGGILGHCALCWPAAALTAISLAALASLRLRRT